MKLVLASKNKKKLAEMNDILSHLGVEVCSEAEAGVDVEVEETGSTFEENSFLKANAVRKATGLPALADDSGIAVDALGGAPGGHSARYGDDPALDDWGRLLLLLETLCATGIRVSELQYITVEAARNGVAEIALKGKIRTILLPTKLCRKLLKYAKKRNIRQGQIFLTKKGNGLSRKFIWAEILSDKSKVFRT